MKRPLQHIMEEQSLAILKSKLPPSWIIRNIEKDYGVDLEIEIVDQNLVTGNRIWVQLKSQQTIKKSSTTFRLKESYPEIGVSDDQKLSVEYIPYSLSTKELEYSLQCPFPLLLVLVDISSNEVFWLPMQDEVVGSITDRNPAWKKQQTSTVRIPLWNNLEYEAAHDYPSLRWYSMEPARMYAFTALHYYHHEFQHTGRLSHYEIGDGFIESGEEFELKRSLELANSFISDALNLDVLFGESGIDYFNCKVIPGTEFSGITEQLKAALQSSDQALQKLASKDYTFQEFSILIGKVSHAMDLLSVAISSYQGYRAKYLLTEATAVWSKFAALYSGPVHPIIPITRKTGFLSEETHDS